MSSRLETFVTLCLNGRATIHDVDDFVDRWHGSESHQPLSEFLGLTQDEYARWITNPSVMPAILFSRRYDVPLGQAIARGNKVRLAARAQGDAAQAISSWLAVRGLLP